AGPEPADVVVLDAGGRLVKRLAGGSAGDGAVVWNGRDEDGRRVAPGVYFVALRSARGEVSSKFVLLRPE
ncbi:MAG: hypothetical protein JW952_00690, partial [Candidatus Eisenbacteria bacterium]|nr:hypothetical protein [Candidatus Eisenbacteria bacterium]